jgi:hypothetical protein
MKIKFETVKTVIMTVSLVFNTLIVLLFLYSPAVTTSRLNFPTPPEDGYTTAAALVTFPKSGSATFNIIELDMKPNDITYIQFSMFSGGEQVNMRLHTLYDPDIISVTQTGLGVAIKALREGVTLMQIISTDGIKDIAFIEITE